MHIEINFTEGVIQIPQSSFPTREIGAVVEFHGVVREMEGDQTLCGLSYEAYEPMARSVLARQFAELAEIHPCEKVQFIHRLGWVPVGETSLYMRVMSAHRGEALRFLAESIDRLKMDVPIWKRAGLERRN